MYRSVKCFFVAMLLFVSSVTAGGWIKNDDGGKTVKIRRWGIHNGCVYVKFHGINSQISSWEGGYKIQDANSDNPDTQKVWIAFLSAVTMQGGEVWAYQLDDKIITLHAINN